MFKEETTFAVLYDTVCHREIINIVKLKKDADIEKAIVKICDNIIYFDPEILYGMIEEEIATVYPTHVAKSKYPILVNKDLFDKV